MLAAESGAGLKDLMARMGHDNVRAAMIYQHAVRGAGKAITDAIDRHIGRTDDEDDEGSAGMLAPWAGCTPVTRKIEKTTEMIKAQVGILSLPGPSCMERVTGIEPALSAWEAVQDHAVCPGRRVTWACAGRVTVSPRDFPLVATRTGTQRARAYGHSMRTR
ncbi:hypothetical protein FHU36_006769 [Nonomuraea muscovyensis]|uniref:Phage integrase family protein n=1 Tax=Nonomuraea muscovyensis TaxID=1124761 RepID=A0A7X0C8D8_9ACTN|nr:hypothetical protein [Nonomuraea muscovyensis]